MYNAELIKRQMRVIPKTGREVSEDTGLSMDTVNRAKRGENLNIDTLLKIAECLQIKPAELFTEQTEQAAA